jgi:hypothetical protein
MQRQGIGSIAIIEYRQAKYKPALILRSTPTYKGQQGGSTGQAWLTPRGWGCEY